MCVVEGLFRLLKCIIWRPIKCVFKCIRIVCKTVCSVLPRCCTDWSTCVGLFNGIMLAQIYNKFLLEKIKFPHNVGSYLSISLILFSGVGNSACRQLRCISLLCLPMYCGKPGRGVLKAIVLTYVIAGPITNMGLNAKEVVRVFGCTAHLSQNLTRLKHGLMVGPFQNSLFTLTQDIEHVKDTMMFFAKVTEPIEKEMENTRELNTSQQFKRYNEIRVRLPSDNREYALKSNDTEQTYYKRHLKNIAHRCREQLSCAMKSCDRAFENSFDQCLNDMPRHAAWAVCWPLQVTRICNLLDLVEENRVCDSEKQVDPGLGEGYVYLKRLKREITSDLQDVQLLYRVGEIRQLHDVQDSKETGDRVLQAFEEKRLIMQYVINAVNICVALLFLRIIVAAGSYHDSYLTGIGHDNIYITGYFKTIDKRRAEVNKCTLLPLKKMERSKYVDVHSAAYSAQRGKLFTQVLKVLLEMVTATTFVMLDRLFYEALDVVRQHAEADLRRHNEHDLNIQVDGNGILANAVRMLLAGLNSEGRSKRAVTNRACLPRPRSMPPVYYLKIYGGYLWILLLLYFNPYTLRLKRLICSWFYPRREKQRILHLYNDILKRRIKLSKTLRRKAVQAVRAYYLSGENLLSLRMRYPQLLGWLKVFPAARMPCLICGETEPRNASLPEWHHCSAAECPFVYCSECWVEIGAHCLACDPSLADLSDIDSLSEDDQPNY